MLNSLYFLAQANNVGEGLNLIFQMLGPTGVTALKTLYFVGVGGFAGFLAFKCAVEVGRIINEEEERKRVDYKKNAIRYFIGVVVTLAAGALVGFLLGIVGVSSPF